jgi:phosphoglycolate phosphatase-like HAD superfamily hydrolase
MARVLLFDVDGTLISAGGAGRRSIERALGRHLEPDHGPRPTWLDGMRLDGMTDRLIVRRVLEALGLAFDDATCARVLASYVRCLAEEIRGPGYRVLPGVEAVLPALAAAGATVGLCTGNLREGARIKLGRGGLDRFFGFGDQDPGGFAEDGEAREDIVAAALRRTVARLGRRPERGEVLVVGDTPRDVEAARSAGVPCLAVATGRFAAAELRAAGADHVVPSLAAPEAAALLGLAP